MQANLGSIVADYGFNFFEKIHGPVFLVDRQGRIQRSNAAARKFLKVSKLSLREIEKLTLGNIAKIFPSVVGGLKRTRIGTKRVVLIARNFADSDLFLVEVRR